MTTSRVFVQPLINKAIQFLQIGSDQFKAKNRLYLFLYHLADFFYRNLVRQFVWYRGDSDILETAGVDPLKGFKRQIDIQGKPVKADSATYGYTDASQFVVANPDAPV